MMQRFADWGDSPTPELDAALDHRATHLAYTAITEHAAWVGQLVLEVHEVDPDIGIDDLRRLVHDTAAYRERSGHAGTDLIGVEPDHAPELLAAYESIEAHLVDQADEVPEPPTLGIDLF